MINKKMGFFSSIIIDFLIFVFFMLLLLLVAFFSMMYFLFADKVKLVNDIQSKDKEYFIHEKYGEVNWSEKYGRKINFIVFDKDKNIVFSSDDASLRGLSKEFLEKTPLESAGKFSVKTILNKGKNQSYTQMNLYGEDERDIEFTVIINEERKVVFSSVEDFPKEISENELDYIYENFYGETIVTSFEFETESGEKREVRAFIDGNDIEYFQVLLSRWKWVYLTIFILGVLAYLLVLDRKVKRPINLLNYSIKKMREWEFKEPIHYSGPREFKEICDNFNEMSQALLKSERDKKRMISDISHDLKTPMTIVQSYTKALSDGMVQEKDKEKYYNIIYSKCDKLNRLVNELSQFSKVGRDDFSLNLEKVDFTEFIREFFIEKYDELMIMGFNIEMEIPEEKNYLSIDRFHMTRVLENIVSNTVKHNQKGTTIFCSLEKGDNQVILCIGDNGHGIPEHVRENIFKPFTIGDKSRTGESSSGLGMAIVETIVKSHRGNIVLLDDNSEYNTLFRITLPIRDNIKLS